MPFVFSNRQKLAAFFIIFGIILLIVISAFILKGNRIFESKGHYYAYFLDGKGINEGSVIKYKGFSIGKVTKIKLLADYQIRVDFIIYKDYVHLIRYDTVLKMSSSLLGSSGLIIQFFEHKQYMTLPDHSQVLSSDTPAGQDILAKISEEMAKPDDIALKAQMVLDMVLDMKPMINSILANLRDITYDIKILTSSLNNNGSSELSKKLFSTLDKANDLLDDLYPSVANLKEVSQDAKQITGKVKADLPSIMQQIDTVLEKIDKISTNIQDLPEEIQEILILLKQNLIQLKYVLENIPLIPKTGSGSSSITTGGR